LLSQRISDAISRQIVAEFSSAYLYLAMAAHFEGEDLQGFAHWMRIQAQEEASHALVFFNFLTERSGMPVLCGLDAPPAAFGTPQEVFKKVKDHERKVTAAIDELVDLAVQEKDHATRAMLNWFVTEQVEEQSVTSSIHARLKRLDGEPSGLLFLDKELAARIYVAPPQLAGK
jgi:ferritin